MACKYHPTATIAGNCAECKSEFCQECGVPFNYGTLCLDCAAKYAKKKIIHSYIAIGLGFVVGFFLIREFLIAPIVYAYIFFGTFWGWHYGGRVWPWLGRLSDKLSEGPVSMFLAIFLFTIRLSFAAIVGCLGGGIVQFLWCRRIAERQEQLASNSHIVQ